MVCTVYEIEFGSNYVAIKKITKIKEIVNYLKLSKLVRSNAVNLKKTVKKTEVIQTKF